MLSASCLTLAKVRAFMPTASATWVRVSRSSPKPSGNVAGGFRRRRDSSCPTLDKSYRRFCPDSVPATLPEQKGVPRVRGYARGTSPLLILPHSPSSRPRLVGTDGASPCPPPRLWHPRTARGVVCARRRQDKGACTGPPFPTPALATTGTLTPAHRPRRQVHGSGVLLGAMRVPHNPHTPATLLYRVVCYPARLVRHCKGLSGWMSTPSM